MGTPSSLVARVTTRALAAALVLVLAESTPLEAQDGRYRVLIPDFQSQSGADRKFGEQAAETLRERMDALVTHSVVARKELESELKEVDVRMADLDCLRTRQVGALMDVEVVLCASYQPADGGVRVEAAFWDLNNNESIEVEPFTVGSKEGDAAAQRIFDAFDRFVQLAAHTRNCVEYVLAHNFEDGLRNCDQALAMSPTAVLPRYQKARALYDTGRLEEAYGELETLLEMDPLHESGRQLAGYVATQLGREDEGRGHYNRYLELQPGAVAVRRKVAYDLFDAGDPEGAMLLIEEGLALEAAPDLYLDLGNYAFAAAAELETSGEEVKPAASELYRKALDAYGSARGAMDEELTPVQLRNMVSALMKLGEAEGAVAMGREAVAAHPDDAALWSVQAEALRGTGQLPEALAALDRLVEVDPSYARVHLRRGSWLLEDGRTKEALAAFERAVAAGEDPDVAARTIFATAYGSGVKNNRWGFAIELIEGARALGPQAETRAMLDFWQGYSLYQQGMTVGEPQTKASAEKALPLFQRALDLFQAGRMYAASERTIDLSKFLQATQTYIEIQEAILKRGR